ncbi:hypothetical protein GMD78_07180 [Ornithinibacillus sp. L9]|uniref:Uncharacterized protein n=1 Tax=Ornithinibacillus caprae TaxID=2678566 RepID=A0A6N8FHK8_9BACI|nr:hypothetical protein [Ornithinibacillus caprae]MUK88176.1 hypothetical protein [Ornithinibacillus caprae]
MSTKPFKNNRLRVMYFWFLTLIIILISVLYIAEKFKYANEKEKLDKVNMHLYDIEVEDPLKEILLFLGTRPIETVDWEEQQFREELSSIFNNIEDGITNINNSEVEAIPEKIHELLQTLQKEITSIQDNTHIEKPLEQQTKEKIMDFSTSISSCKVDELNRNWEQAESEVECLNEQLLFNNETS